MENKLSKIQQNILLAAALTAGILLDIAFEFIDGDVIVTLCFVGIFAVCLGIFLYINWETVWANRRRTLSWVILAGALTVMIALPFRAAKGFSMEFAITGFIAVPLMLLLYAATVLYEVPVHEEGRYLLGALRMGVVSAVLSVPDFFKAIGNLFRGRGSSTEDNGAPITEGKTENKGGLKRRLPALIGVVVGLVLLVIVMLLLTEADDNMGSVLAEFRDALCGIDIMRWVLRSFIVFRMMLYVFPLMFGIRFKRGEAPKIPAFRLPAVTLSIVGVSVLLAYVLFLGLQFSYLFGGTLPEACTYSEYAVKGFTELIIVSAINDVLLALMESYSEKNALISVIRWAILLCNALLLASAGLRLGMYISAYGWTEKRFLSAWLTVFVAFLTVLTAIRFIRKEIPLRKIAGAAFIVWYALLFVTEWSAVFGF